MVLGKTIQALAFIAHHNNDRDQGRIICGQSKPILVVAPKVVISQWATAVEEHLS